MVLTKTLASVITGLMIMLPFRHALVTVCGKCNFLNYFEKSASLSKPKTLSAPINTSIKSLINEVLRAYKTLLLGKRIKIRFPSFGGSKWEDCLTISFNICTIMCAVATYVHSRFLSKFVKILVSNSLFGFRSCWSYSSSLLLCLCCASACNLGIGIMPLQSQSLHLFTDLSDYHKCCKLPDHKCWMPADLVKEITVLQKSDWRSLHLCSAG